MAKDNIAGAITRASVVTKKSAKTGNDYSQFEVTVNMPDEGSYKFVTFLNEEQVTLLNMAVPLKQKLLDDDDER